MSEAFQNPQLNEAVADLIKQHNLHIEGLTADQLGHVLKQVILSGDIQRLVRASDGSQQVIYVPFNERESLKTELDRWKKFATGIIDAAKENVAEGCGDEGDYAVLDSCIEHGLGNVRKMPYNPDEHGYIEGDFATGDLIYYWG